MASFFFIARRVVFLLVAFGIGYSVWHRLRAPDWVYDLAWVSTMILVVVRSLSHVHRVRLVSGRRDAEALRARHRRQVELPFPADEAFTLVEAAIRELPNVDTVESARDSLQVHARLRRPDPKAKRRNLVHATVTPGERVASVTLISEPEGGAWRDWLTVDDGANLDAIEATTRAITRRVSERRKVEEAQARETASEKELGIAKLSLLQAQVEPHFLYNTLANAQVLTRSDPAKADRMIGNLRQTLEKTGPSPICPAIHAPSWRPKTKRTKEALKRRRKRTVSPNASPFFLTRPRSSSTSYVRLSPLISDVTALEPDQSAMIRVTAAPIETAPPLAWLIALSIDESNTALRSAGAR